MAKDLLVPLLTKKDDQTLGYRQGVVLTWNQDTAENTIQVAGAVLTNLPILNTSEASILAPGDVVGILTSGPSYAILGRLTIPGTDAAVSSIQSITNRIQASEDSSQGSRNSTSYGDLTGTSVGPAVTIRIGSSGRALVFWAAEMGQTPNYQIKNNPHIGIAVSGATTIAPSNLNALNWHFEFPPTGFLGDAQMASWIQAANFHLFTGLNPGDTTFTMKYRHDGNDPVNAVNFNAREIAVFAL